MNSALTINYPSKTDSPIRHLLPSVGPAIERIAPERADELATISSHLQLEISVEVAWAFAFAYYVFYKQVLEGTSPDGSVVDLTARKDVQPALLLLEWALGELVGGNEQPWPTDIPRPVPSPTFASESHVADEITLCVLAFFLHHELAHTYVDIAVGESSLDHERACDAAAAKWIFGTAGLDELRLQKRALGVAIALLIITARGIQTGDHDGKTHPIDFDRLVETLVAYVPADIRVVWSMVTGVLALHATHVGISAPGGAYDDFKDAALAYRDLLRDRANSGRTHS